MIGVVTKKNADKFLVENNWLTGRGNLKTEGVFVGDVVEYDENVILKVLPRKNLLIRPPMANLDKMFIVIAPSPKPDFLLVDKLLIYCEINDIQPIICVNKCDLIDKNLENLIKTTYSSVAKVIFVSALQDNIESLKQEIIGTCAFAGQSAVGKSSLINSLLGGQVEVVGELAKKTERGKQTTRLVTLYKFSDGFIADTAGFSKLDERLLKIEERKLTDYYPDFKKYIEQCPFVSCTHIKENECVLRQAVKSGKVSQMRYDNYQKIYQALKEIKHYEKKN